MPHTRPALRRVEVLTRMRCASERKVDHTAVGYAGLMAKQPKVARSVGAPLIAPNEMRAEIQRLNKVVEAGTEKEATKAAEKIRRLKAKAKKDSRQMFEATRVARVGLVAEVVARLFDAKTGLAVQSLLLAQTHSNEGPSDSCLDLYGAIYSTLAAHSPIRVLPSPSDRNGYNQLVRMLELLSPEERAAMVEQLSEGPLLTNKSLAPQARAAMLKRLAGV